jgi:hypothetical protein
MDNLKWNCWNLVLIRSDMKGIFSSIWIVRFDTYQGASRMDRRTLDWNLWIRTMLEAFAEALHFHGVRQRWYEDRLVYRQFVVQGKFRPPTKEGSEKIEFSVQSCLKGST